LRLVNAKEGYYDTQDKRFQKSITVSNCSVEFHNQHVFAQMTFNHDMSRVGYFINMPD